MTLLEWKEREKEKGTYAGIQKRLKEKTGHEYSRIWLKKIFTGVEAPGRDLFIALSQMTGLTIDEMAEQFNERRINHE